FTLYMFILKRWRYLAPTSYTLFPYTTLFRSLILPTDRVAVFQANLLAYEGKLSSWQTYKTTKGENYASIAKRHGITLAQLRKARSEEHTSELQSRENLVCRILLEIKIR